MSPPARFSILLGSLLVLLCALLVWLRPSTQPHIDPPPPPSAATGSPTVPLDSSPAPSAEPALSPRLQLERQCLALAEDDPLAAMEFALKHHLTADDPGLLTSLILQWASHDFDAAYDWTKTQEAGAWRDKIRAHLAYLRAKTDPLAAARLVVTDISAGPARNEAIISIVHQWALQDAEAAGLWARSLADEALRQRASAEVAGLVTAASAAKADAPAR